MSEQWDADLAETARTLEAMTPTALDEAARALYASWTAEWAELDVFIAEKLGGDLKNITPRRIVAAMQGMERPQIARPLLVAFVDRSAWSQLNHRHHHTERMPIRGHVYILGMGRTSTDDGHFHEVDAATQWTGYATIDFSLFG